MQPDSSGLNFTVPILGAPTVHSPINMSAVLGDNLANYVEDGNSILYDIIVRASQPSRPNDNPAMLERAGPRENIYFDPQRVRAGIVSCGGLCPGINNVIRAVVRSLWYAYGVRRIVGIRNGYKGFLPEYGFRGIDLDPDVVDDIHQVGGSILGTSRGGGDRINEIVDTIERMKLDILFTIGGDGTQKGALAIVNELDSRGLKVAVIGIPKTIDNDLSIIQKSFGFETAVARAVEAVSAAHAEAHSSIGGIGLVKLMGRESGFIAAQTTLAVNEANFVLIPEIPFDLTGPNGLLVHLERRLAESNHAVIVVAEGAGQDLLEKQDRTDRSGNPVLSDIGVFLRDGIKEHFERIDTEINIKYIDPSYMIRSSVAESTDAYYCARLGSNAAHAAMAGRTKMLVGLVNDHYVHIPIDRVVSSRKHVDPEGSLWRDVLNATQQPEVMKNSIS